MSSLDPTRPAIAFAGTELIASDDLATVAVAVKRACDSAPTTDPSPIVLDAETSRPIELDLRGTVDEVLARLAPAPGAPAADKRGPGRPKLGVVAREVTLLPRHWEWLAEQPGGASVTLRKLVEQARRDSAGSDRARQAQDSTYRFMLAVAGNEPGFEAANRALYAGDTAGFETATTAWPAGVRDHARTLAAPAFEAGGEE